MKVTVKAYPNASKELVEKRNDGSFAIFVKEPPVKGRANAAISRALATYFGVSSSAVRLVSGFSSRNKMFEIMRKS